MQFSDLTLLIRKILVGMLIALIPFLIIWGGLRLVPEAFKGAPPASQPSNPPKPN